MGEHYDSGVEFAIAVVVALIVLGSQVPRIDRLPWQGGFVLFGEKKQPLKVVYRIWATWRLERLNLSERVLTQHFEVLKGAPQYQFRNNL
jgi:hypothetical protein